MLSSMLKHLLLEIRIVQFLAQHIDQVVVVAAQKPGRANRVVVALFCLAGGIPGLNDLVAVLTLRRRVVSPKPAPLNNFALLRHRGLLILRGEPEAAERCPDAIEHYLRLARLVKKFPGL